MRKLNGGWFLTQEEMLGQGLLKLKEFKDFKFFKKNPEIKDVKIGVDKSVVPNQKASLKALENELIKNSNRVQLELVNFFNAFKGEKSRLKIIKDMLTVYHHQLSSLIVVLESYLENNSSCLSKLEELKKSINDTKDQIGNLQSYIEKNKVSLKYLSNDLELVKDAVFNCATDFEKFAIVMPDNPAKNCLKN